MRIRNIVLVFFTLVLVLLLTLSFRVVVVSQSQDFTNDASFIFHISNPLTLNDTLGTTGTHGYASSTFHFGVNLTNLLHPQTLAQIHQQTEAPIENHHQDHHQDHHEDQNIVVKVVDDDDDDTSRSKHIVPTKSTEEHGKELGEEHGEETHHPDIQAAPLGNGIVEGQEDEEDPLPVPIFLDFLTWDSSLFTIPSYAAMDSILHMYPSSSFKVLFTASRRIKMYRLGNMLSYYQFEKYVKRGYDISNEIVDVTKYPVKEQHLGGGWWKLHKDEFPAKLYNDREGDKTLSFLQSSYFRIMKLYEFGGLSFDFSAMFLRPLPEDMEEGYFFHQTCQGKEDQLHQIRFQNHSIAERMDGILTQKKHPICVSSSIMMFKKPSSRLLKCVLQQFDDASSTINKCPMFLEAREYPLDEEYHCLAEAFKQCKQTLNMGKQSLSLKPSIYDFSKDLQKSVDIYNQAGSGLLRLLETHSNIKLLSLGALAHSFIWRQPGPNSLFSKLTSILQPTKYHPFHKDPKCHVPCSPFAPPSRQIRYADEELHLPTHCAPHFVIPGTMKAATSFMFKALTTHPQVLPPIKGFQYKEAGAYLPAKFYNPEQYRHRVGFFPYISNRENYVTGDGTVVYSMFKEPYNRILADNQNMKFIFVVRNPVIRVISHWRYMYHVIIEYNKEIDSHINDMLDHNVYQEIRQAVIEGDLDKAYSLKKKSSWILFFLLFFLRFYCLYFI